MTETDQEKPFQTIILGPPKYKITINDHEPYAFQLKIPVNAYCSSTPIWLRAVAHWPIFDRNKLKHQFLTIILRPPKYRIHGNNPNDVLIMADDVCKKHSFVPKAFENDNF